MSDIVSRIEDVIEEVNNEGHPVTFAALVERADSDVASRDLIISSPWLIERGKLRSYNYLKEKLIKHLNKADWQEFNRVVVLNPDDDFVQDLSIQVNRFKNSDLLNIRVAGVNLRYAHIYAAPGSYLLSHLTAQNS